MMMMVVVEEIRREVLGVGEETERLGGAEGVEVGDGVMVDEVGLDESGEAIKEGDAALLLLLLLLVLLVLLLVLLLLLLLVQEVIMMVVVVVVSVR